MNAKKTLTAVCAALLAGAVAAAPVLAASSAVPVESTAPSTGAEAPAAAIEEPAASAARRGRMLPVNLDSFQTEIPKDFAQAAQLPVTGWFTKTVGEGRTMKIYIAPEASVRSYFTVVAVPDGVDTQAFLQEQGWFDVADAKGEGLIVLEPGKGGWGGPVEEAEYLDAAMAVARTGANAAGIVVFSVFGEFYLAGYGTGAAILEAWAAANPILVISQVYAEGKSTGSAALETLSGEEYDGVSANGDITEVLDETIAAVGITEGRITRADVPVPTWLAGYTGSDAYWKTANDCLEKADGEVYYQALDADAYQTHHANQRLAQQGVGHGLSEVRVSEKAGTAAEAYAWLSQWTRYDTTFAYSNVLAQRLDYTAARVAAQREAKDQAAIAVLLDGTEVLAQETVAIEGHGKLQVGVIRFADDNGDGANDPREYMVYVPDGYEGQALPVLVIYPGNTQTDSIFMDSTLWWQQADDNGIALALVCETYNANASSVSHSNSARFHTALMTLLDETVDGELATLDFNRVYGTGQSAGSMTSQNFAVVMPELFAAVASTSAAPRILETAQHRLIPSMLVTGQMDVADLGLGLASESLGGWGQYMLEANGFDADFAEGEGAELLKVDSRHPEMYSWQTEAGIPLVQWAQCLLRPHNCYPSEMSMLWDFMKHYSKDPVSGVRYYSASAFAKDDAVRIGQ